MGTVKKTKFKVFNGTDYDTKHFETSADQVVRDDGGDVEAALQAIETALPGKVAKADVANNLTTTESGKVLDARQGKALADQVAGKVAKADVANNLTTTESGKILDARQGKALNDRFGDYYTSNTVDSKIAGRLSTSGGTINGNLSVNGNMDSTGDLALPWGKAIKWGGASGIIYCADSQQMYLRANYEGNYALHLGVHDDKWALDPDADAQLMLGTDNHRWNTLYAYSSTIVTSDRNAKNSIAPLDDRYIQLFLRLLPVSYKLNAGTSGRTHIGFIAQDVESAMEEVGLSSLEFAGFCKAPKMTRVRKTQKVKVLNDETGEEEWNEITYMEDEPVEGEYVYALRYEEFIGLMAAVLQRLIARVDALEAEAKKE